LLKSNGDDEEWILYTQALVLVRRCSAQCWI
jgi:hypothetical protein